MVYVEVVSVNRVDIVSIVRTVLSLEVQVSRNNHALNDVVFVYLKTDYRFVFFLCVCVCVLCQLFSSTFYCSNVSIQFRAVF